MNKETLEKNSYLVKKVSLMDTFRNLPLGKPVAFECSVAGTFAAAQVAVCRLNKKEGMWRILSEDNGATYVVTRLK